MNLSATTQEKLLVLSEGCPVGLFPVVTVLSEDKVAPLVALGFEHSLPADLFAVVLTLRKMERVAANCAFGYFNFNLTSGA